MSGIWKINMLQNLTTKQDLNKLSFKKDDSFVARALKLDGSTSEIILKLLDGRTFPAKVEGFINEPLDNYIFKFIVDGFEDGKLKIKLLDSKPNANTSEEQIKQNTLEELTSKLNFTIESKDINIIKSMIKYNLPISEESFNEVKNFTDFIDKIKASPLQEESFISKYLSSRNIDPGSTKGTFIKDTLTSFFAEAKKLDLNSILMMKEMELPITEENIKSFLKVSSKEFNIFNEVESLKSNVLNTIKDTDNTKTTNTVTFSGIESKKNVNNFLQLENDTKVKSNIFVDDIIVDDEIKTNMLTKEQKNVDNKLNFNANNIDSKSKEKVNINNNESSFEEFKIGETQNKELKEKLINNLDKEVTLKSNSIREQIIKEEIKDKLLNLKTSIQDIIKLTEDNQNTASKVFQLLENKLQDIKMFNTINNDYYYLNLPMNIKEDKYDCKLIIKDERSKGKKLDSKNLKIATSIVTLNMNTIDSYITVLNNNVSIEIQSEEKFTKPLEVFKGKLLESLGDDKYYYNINIKTKAQEFSLLKCREFFSDNDLNSINVKV